MPGSVIVAGARTPIGKLSGALTTLSAVDLGALAIKAALERSGVVGEDVDYVYVGQVILAGSGQAPARQAAVAAGIPLSTPCASINKVCLSGLNAIYLADQMISAGDAEVVVAAGMESMSQAPYLVRGARSGLRFGHSEIVDSMLADGLEDPRTKEAMGAATERDLAEVPGLNRERQDHLAAMSHARAANATSKGWFAEEIVPVRIAAGRTETTVDQDEGIRIGSTVESLSRLRPAFTPGGTITAGNASQISDGASAVVLTSREFAERKGLHPLGEVLTYGQVAGPSTSLLLQPAEAIRKAAMKAGIEVNDIELFEINEAFAAVVLASSDELKLDEEIVNVNGGAVALGHPIGASGNRLALTLLHELRRRQGRLGVAALCGGGGQGDALLVRAF